MRFPLCLAGLLTLTSMSLAAAAEPPAGGYKTNVVAPTAVTSPDLGVVLPVAQIFGGAPFRALQGSADVTDEITVPASDTQKAGVRFKPGQIYTLIRANASTEPEKAVRGRRPFPILFGGMGRSKSGAPVPFIAQPYFIYGRVPLAWDGGPKAYASGLTVFYEIDPDGVVPPANFSMAVRFDAQNATVQPSEVTVTPTEQSQRVMVRSPWFDRTVVVSMKVGGQEFKSSITASGELGSLRLTAAQPEIAGFGAGQTGLHVEGFDPLEHLLVGDEALGVTFTVEGPATVTPTSVTIPAGASGVDVMLKSTGAGLVTVTAKSAKGPIATTKVKLRPILGNLVLRSGAPEIPGFGAGKTDVKVQRVDPAGQPLPADDALSVSFTVSGPLKISPSTVTIPAGATEAAVTVESTGFGVATVTAGAVGKTSAPLQIGVRSVLGKLKLTADHPSIADFGAGQTDLVVQRLDPNGNALSGEDALPVTFLVSGAGKLTPASVTIPAGQSSARINLKSSGEGSVVVTAVAGGSTSDETKIALTKTTHRLRLTPERTAALGLGLGRTTLTLTRQDAGGKEFADPQPATVPLQISGSGVLETPQVEFKAGETTAKVVVKGKGSGSAQVKPTGSFESNTAEIEFVLPWALLVATLLGCGIGVAARHFKAQNKTKRPSAKLLIRAALVAVAVIAIGLAGGALNVLPQGLIATFTGALLFGGVLGLFGTYAMDMFMSPPPSTNETPAV